MDLPVGFLTGLQFAAILLLLAAGIRLAVRWRWQRQARQEWQDLRLRGYDPGRPLTGEDYVAAHVRYHDPTMLFWMAAALAGLLVLTPLLDALAYAILGTFRTTAPISTMTQYFMFWTLRLILWGGGMSLVAWYYATHGKRDEETIGIVMDAEKALVRSFEVVDGEAIRQGMQERGEGLLGQYRRSGDAVRGGYEITTRQSVDGRGSVMEVYVDPPAPPPLREITWFREGGAPTDCPSTNRPHMDAGVDWDEVNHPAYYLPLPDSPAHGDTVQRFLFDTACASDAVIGEGGRWDGRIHIQFWIGDRMLPLWVELRQYNQIPEWLDVVEKMQAREPAFEMDLAGSTHPSVIEFRRADGPDRDIYTLVHLTQSSPNPDFVPFNIAGEARVDIRQVEASLLNDLLGQVMKLSREEIGRTLNPGERQARREARFEALGGRLV